MSRMVHEQPLITREHPRSALSESYRTLRTNIRFSLLGQAVKIILVTSSVPGEGRTTTAANLAVAYAQEDKRVLLLDGDLRQPSIHKLFRRVRRQGLSHLLIGDCSLEDAIFETDVANLSVLAAGMVPPNPTELLGSERMRTLLQNLREAYDVVIIDSPPALSVADAQILGALSDGVVLVVRSGKATKDAVRRVRTSLEHVNAPILGAVLNHSGKSKRDYEYDYSKFYGGD